MRPALHLRLHRIGQRIEGGRQHSELVARLRRVTAAHVQLALTILLRHGGQLMQRPPDIAQQEIADEHRQQEDPAEHERKLCPQGSALRLRVRVKLIAASHGEVAQRLKRGQYHIHVLAAGAGRLDAAHGCCGLARSQ